MITKVFILQEDTGPDTVYLSTTEPSPSPNLTEKPLDLKFTVAADGGPAYVRALGVPDELVEVMNREYTVKFSRGK
jgi:hypothetical protein